MHETHVVNLRFVFDSKLFFGFQLCGKTVCIPAENAVYFPPFHCLIARNHILCVAGKKMSVMRKTVCERRSVEEYEFIVEIFAGFAADNGLIKSVVLFPVAQSRLFQLRKVGIGNDIFRSCVGNRFRVHRYRSAHFLLPSRPISVLCREDDRFFALCETALRKPAAVPPRLPEQLFSLLSTIVPTA